MLPNFTSNLSALQVSWKVIVPEQPVVYIGDLRKLKRKQLTIGDKVVGKTLKLYQWTGDRLVYICRFTKKKHKRRD